MNRNLVFSVLLVTGLQLNPAHAGSTVIVNGITQTGPNNSLSIGGVSFDGVTDDAGRLGVIKRPLKKFNWIKNSTSADIFIQIAERSEVIIEGDENIIKLIDTSIEGASLVLSNKKGYSSNTQLVIRIYTPELLKLDLNGAGDVQLKALNGPMFEVTLNGTADIVAEGRVNYLKVTINGAGDVDFNRLHSQKSVVSLNGAADIYLYTTHSLKASIQGSGTIYVSGKPKTVSKNISGAGEILMQ